MKIRHLFTFFAVLFAFNVACSQGKVKPKTEKATTDRPNIILIMADDMGYSDIAPYGGEIDTPNLTKLANTGVRFTQFYNTARCCPTRASLLTGLYPHQAGIGHMTNSPERPNQDAWGVPQYEGYLSKNAVTLAEVLKGAGYNTLMTGKWHVGEADSTMWPLQRGFNKFYGILAGAANHFKPEYPRGITRGNDRGIKTGDDYYSSDNFTTEAINFIDSSKTNKPKDPFFLYLAYTAPHWPLEAPQKVIDKYKGKYSEGWQKLRLERYKRMKKMGIIDPNWELTPQDSRPWNSLSDKKKKEMDLRMAIYAAMVDRMDQNIGRLMDYLKRKKMMDNTFIVFLSDNGACAEWSELGNGPASQLETKEGYGLTYGRAWANASDTPYKLYKHYLHEGGISTPFIVHWPNGISDSLNGKMIRYPAFLPDIMATYLDLTNADYPSVYKGHNIYPFVGRSILPTLKNPKLPVHDNPLYWEHEGNKAVRLGNYKLVDKWKDKKKGWELYNMKNDRSEMHDLSKQYPEMVQQMSSLYDTWAAKTKVMPWDKALRIQKEIRVKRKNKKKAIKAD